MQHLINLKQFQLLDDNLVPGLYFLFFTDKSQVVYFKGSLILASLIINEKISDPMILQSDKIVWEKFLSGDKDAYGYIYHKYFQTLYEYGLRICRDPDLVKDTIQDLFVKLWSHRQNISVISPVKAYLLTSLKYSLLNKFKKKSFIAAMHIDDMPYDFEMIYDEASNDEVFNNYFQKIIPVLNRLTAKQKEIIYLRYYEGLNYEEIAALMNISVKGCYKLASRAIRLLKESLVTMIILIGLAAKFGHEV